MPVVDLTLEDIFHEAFEMAGESFHTGYDVRVARRALAFVLDEWSNRGLHLWKVEEGSLSTTDGTAKYTLPTDTVDLVEHVIRDSQGVDYRLRRVRVGDYATLSQKSLKSRPTLIYVDRQITPTVTLWPTPDATYTLVYWRMKRLEGISSGIEGSTDTPNRFRPALAAAIAKRVALVRGNADRVPYLDGEAERQFILATDADVDDAPYQITPDYGRVV